MKVLHDDDGGKTQVEFFFEDTPDLKFTLVYDFNEIADAEAVCGFNLLVAVLTPSLINAAQLRGLLYALANTKHPATDPKLGLKHAGDMITKDVMEVFRAVAACCGVSIREPAPPPKTDDEAMFAAMEEMVVERPVALLEMLARLKVPAPPALAETVAAE
jgi:xanthosine utilization system XapX-like protein